jgi:ribosomal protein S6
MSTSSQYELVYIVTPAASEEQVAELHTQIEQIVQRYGGTLDKTDNWGRQEAGLRDRPPPRGRLRGRD